MLEQEPLDSLKLREEIKQLSNDARDERPRTFRALRRPLLRVGPGA